MDLAQPVGRAISRDIPAGEGVEHELKSALGRFLLGAVDDTRRPFEYEVEHEMGEEADDDAVS
jgi:hypothetical protein